MALHALRYVRINDWDAFDRSSTICLQERVTLQDDDVINVASAANGVLRDMRFPTVDIAELSEVHWYSINPNTAEYYFRVSTPPPPLKSAVYVIHNFKGPRGYPIWATMKPTIGGSRFACKSRILCVYTVDPIRDVAQVIAYYNQLAITAFHDTNVRLHSILSLNASGSGDFTWNGKYGFYVKLYADSANIDDAFAKIANPEDFRWVASVRIENMYYGCVNPSRVCIEPLTRPPATPPTPSSERRGSPRSLGFEDTVVRTTMAVLSSPSAPMQLPLAATTAAPTQTQPPRASPFSNDNGILRERVHFIEREISNMRNMINDLSDKLNTYINMTTYTMDAHRE
jgi:hypothetical protein